MNGRLIETAILARPALHAPQASDLTKVVVCAVVLAWGLSCAWQFFRRPHPPSDKTATATPNERPWRRVGGAICALLAIMFVLGVALVDIPDYPRAYAAYWIVMMVLVVWLCALAAKDMMYTLRTMAKTREDRRNLLLSDLKRNPSEETS